MSRYTTVNEGDRSFAWLWFIRAVALVVTLITLGLTASSAATFGAIACSTPGKLGYNLAVAVISFVALIYLLLSIGPHRTTKILPWVIFGQLALDGLLFIFWIAAAATSSYNCNDLCNACHFNYSEVSYGGLICDCGGVIFYNKEKRNTSPAPKGLLKSRDVTSTGGSSAAIVAFDAIMTVIFAVCLAATVFWFIQSRKNARMHNNGTTTTAPTVGGSQPIKHEEAGMAAPGGDPTGPYHPQQPYNGGQQQPQQQPAMHQVPYPQGGNPPYQQPPQMSHQAQPMQEQYTGPVATGAYGAPPPPQPGTVEMPLAGQKGVDGRGAPEVRA